MMKPIVLQNGNELLSSAPLKENRLRVYELGGENRSFPLFCYRTVQICRYQLDFCLEKKEKKKNLA